MRKYRELPKQDNALVQLLAERYVRSSESMSSWAEKAKECVKMTEGEQWSAEELRQLAEQGRPAFQFNKIGRLVRLVLGYHRNNRTDAKFLPGHDGTGSQAVADALTHLAKHTSELNQEPYIDAEVMLDGIITGRGYYDARMDYTDNDFGDLKLVAKDPFSIKVDPDADKYDLNEGGFVMEDRWASIDEIAFTYGPTAEMLVSPLLQRGGYAGMPSSITTFMETITPWRTFGGGYDDNPYIDVLHYLSNTFDPYRKDVKLIDCQHYVRVMQRCFIDLETGDKHAIPDKWDDNRIKKVLAWTQDRYAQRGKLSPIRVQWRPMRRVRWTTLVGDIIVYDGWSPYQSFTLTGFFPWFRRGKTRGMVEDLIDPQKEINKRRNANIEIVARNANSGWKYHKNSMSEDAKERLERDGSAPGFHLEWEGEVWQEPKRIEPGNVPQGLKELEDRANNDLNEISGINESALGEIDRVQSGRAIEARQRQAVISVQTYMDNNSRTKELLARKKLEIYQSKYDAPRIVSVLGDSGSLDTMRINQVIEATGEILNNVTLGRYRVLIDETPLSASYLSAQFDEAMQMVEKGVLPVEIAGEDLIDMSSIPRKDIIKKKVTAYLRMKGIPTTEDVLNGTMPLPVPGAQPGAGAGAPPPAAAQPALTPSLASTGNGSVVDPTGAEE